MRQLIGLLLVLVSTSYVSAEEPPLPPVSPKSLVSIGTMSGMASGTIVSVKDDSAYILTAEHVVYPNGDKTKKILVIHGRKRAEGEVLKSDAVIDIAVVRVKGLDKPEPIKFAEKGSAEGDTIFHYGRATGPQDGKVLKFSMFVNRGRTALSDIISVCGDSSALTCNTKGELVGMHIGRTWDDAKDIETKPGYGIDVNLEIIKKFTAAYRD